MKYTVQIVGVGYKVAMSEVHGMAQRGGSVLSTLRFGDDVISPLEAAGSADLIMGFEPAETCRNLPLGNKDTVILMNLDPVLPSMVAAGFEEYPSIDSLKDAVSSVNKNLYTIDATKIAIEAGKAVAANAVMIGAVAAMKGFPIPKDDLLKSLMDQVPDKFKDLNKKAFEMGYSAMSS
jgi:indolepyruvate ferredoxin oxidoreductase beta subunit